MEGSRDLAAKVRLGTVRAPRSFEELSVALLSGQEEMIRLLRGLQVSFPPSSPSGFGSGADLLVIVSRAPRKGRAGGCWPRGEGEGEGEGEEVGG